MTSMTYLTFSVGVTAHPPRGPLRQSTTPPCVHHPERNAPARSVAALLLPHPGRSPHPCRPPPLLVACADQPKLHCDKANWENAARSAVHSKTAGAVVGTRCNWPETWLASSVEECDLGHSCLLPGWALAPLDLVVSDCRLQPFAFAQVEAVQGVSCSFGRISRHQRRR